MAGPNPGGNAWNDINAFVAGPGAGLKSPAQAAAIHGRAEIEQQQIKAGAKVQVAQIQQAGQNQRAAQRLSQAQAYRQQQMQLRQQSQQRMLANQQARQAQQQQRTNVRKAQAVGKAGQTALNANPILGVHDRIASMPTPGGLGTLVFILLVLVFAIVPVNQGQTRLSLLWLTLLGRTTLDGSSDAGSSYDPTNGGTFDPNLPPNILVQAGAKLAGDPYFKGQASGQVSGAGSTVAASANLNASGLPNVKLPGR